MLNDTTFLSVRESVPTPDPSPSHQLTVRMNAGADALPRLVNLMAKLDIEPPHMLVEKSPCGKHLTAVIAFGEDTASMERLILRLSRMVTVCAIEAGHCS